MMTGTRIIELVWWLWAPVLTMTMLIAVAAQCVHAEDGPCFANREAVARMLDHDPEKAVAVLEGLLTQEELDGIEAGLCPVPSGEDLAVGLRSISVELRRMGLGKDDALVRSVDARANALRAR